MVTDTVAESSIELGQQLGTFVQTSGLHNGSCVLVHSRVMHDPQIETSEVRLVHPSPANAD